jgi:hypothetical protein
LYEKEVGEDENMKLKLSPTQEKILELMSEGWELLRDSGSSGKCNLSKGHEWKTVSVATWWKLQKLGLIGIPSGLQFPTEHWKLTEKGQQYVNIIIRGIH